MCRKRRTQISILVPYQTTDPIRVRVWNWLHRYWRHELPRAEIIIGTDPKSQKRWYRRHPKSFSKTAAVNRAFCKSHGDIIVIMDADSYLDAKVVVHCAARIRTARAAGSRLWFVPYTSIYRLTEPATEKILYSSPSKPYVFPTPPPEWAIEGSDGSGWGRKFGALCQIMPREAFIAVRGMDERFRGWGGEDVSLLRALDRLWAWHSNTPNDILHLWHPKITAGVWESPGGAVAEVRAWEGQDKTRANDWLSMQYNYAAHWEEMKRLIDQPGHTRRWRRLR